MGRRKKKNIFPKIIVIVVVLLILGLGGYGYIKYNPMVEDRKAEIQEITNYLKNEFMNQEITKDIELPQTFKDYRNITLVWVSSDEMVISNSGLVNLPSYSSGDKKVKLKVTYNVNDSDFLFNLAWKFLGGNYETTLEVIVKATEATPEEKISIIEAGIFVPGYSNTNIGLLKEDNIFSSVEITWESSNPNIISNNGEKIGIGTTKLIATLKCEDHIKRLEYVTTIGDELATISAFDNSFDNYSKSSYNQTFEKDDLVFVNTLFTFDEEQEIEDDSIAESHDKVARLKATDQESAYFYMTKAINNPKTLSFRYGLINSDSSKVNKNSYLIVYYKTSNESEWVKLSEDLMTSVRVDYYKELSIKGDAYFKVEFITAYKELRIDIDDLKITRSINKDDIEKSLVSSFQTKFTSSRVLPLSTNYGGIITWSSNSNLLDKFGKVTRLESTEKVILTAKITGFDEEIIINFEITIPGKKAVLPVEIYFIDLGKYGLSDCGESIYIRYGNIDILIDAGDNIKTSSQSIKETIDAYSEDKVLEYLIATHPDSDHIGGMPFIFESYEVQNLIQFEGDHTTQLYQKYVEAYTNENCSVCSALESYNNVGECQRIISLGADVYLEIIDTKNYNGKETNTRSVVCILNAYGIRTLLTGDADNGSNSNLENEYKDSVGDIDILKAVHHGTREGTTSAFLEAVDPEVVIICNGNYLGNKHGHPTPEAVNRIYQYDSEIMIYAITGGDSENCSETSSGSYKCDVEDGMIDRNGTIKITIDESGYQINSEYYYENPKEFSSTYYWQNNPLKKYSHQGN